MEDFDKNNNKISLTSQCDKKYHKIKTHPETGIFLYKSIKWKTLEKSDYLRKKPGHVVDPDLFLVVALLEVSKYVLLQGIFVLLLRAQSITSLKLDHCQDINSALS